MVYPSDLRNQAPLCLVFGLVDLAASEALVEDVERRPARWQVGRRPSGWPGAAEPSDGKDGDHDHRGKHQDHEQGVRRSCRTTPTPTSYAGHTHRVRPGLLPRPGLAPAGPLRPPRMRRSKRFSSLHAPFLPQRPASGTATNPVAQTTVAVLRLMLPARRKRRRDCGRCPARVRFSGRNRTVP